MTSLGRAAAAAILAGAILSGGPSLARAEAAAVEPATPRLVLLLAIDQLRRDRLSPDQPGGLGRLQREGRVFSRASLRHAFSETCPGHSTMLTGHDPASTGVPGNRYVEVASGKLRYCVEDDAPDAKILGDSQAGGRSPRVLRVTTLGDWLKAQRPGTRVFSVSAKDRAAITMGGRKPDAAYWLDHDGEPFFTTSGYYMSELPHWVQSWGPERVFEGVPDRWEYGPPATVPEAARGRIDDYPAESDENSRTSPHPLLRGPGDEGDPASSPDYRAAGERLYGSPFMDRATLAFARDLVVEEKLGGGDVTDLLAVSLSATDTVGHPYGPWSWESSDSLARLDRMVGGFLEFLEQRVGRGRLVVVLTADHGVLPLPEWKLERGESTCKLPHGRGDPKALLAGLSAALDERFGKAPAGQPEHAWFVPASTRLTFDRARLRASGVSLDAALAEAVAYLEARDGIARVWTLAKVRAARRDPELSALAELYANSWDPERGGDLAIQVARDCLFQRATGTTHGSPYDYDRDVPLVFFGPGIAAGRVTQPAAPADIAPTLAALLGIEAPPDLDGHALPLR